MTGRGAWVWSAVLLVAALQPAWAASAGQVDEFGAPIPNADALGAKIYQQHCASCHEAGVAKAPPLRMMGFLGGQAIMRALTSGAMRVQGGVLSAAQKTAVTEFVTGAPVPDTLPPPSPMCEAQGAAFDWRAPVSAFNWGLEPGNTRFVSDERAGVTRANVDRLQLRWAFAFPGAQRVRSHPLLAGGAVFIGSEDGTVYALDQDSGCIRWTYRADAEVRTGFALQVETQGNGSPALRRLIFGDLLGRVYALNARNGALLWRVRADAHPAATITGTPVAHDGRVYVPVSSLEVVSARDDSYACCTFRGSVLALDAQTGAEIWRTYTVESVATEQGRTTAGTAVLGPSGAPIWNSPAIDAARGWLYVGTGENYSVPPGPGSDAMLALRLSDGARVWRYQATAGDAWNTACSGLTRRANCPADYGPDFDFGAAMVLSGDGSLVIGGQKSGAVHAVDAADGGLRWSTRLGRGGLHGGIHFGIAVAGERIFAPISDANDFGEHENPARPGLYALELRTGNVLWQAPLEDACAGRQWCDVGIGAAITATDSLVFAGALDGYLRIHDASTGAVLRRLDTTRPVPATGGRTAQGGSMDGASAPLPFHGRLYVTSGYNFAGHMAGNALLVYEVAPPAE